MFGSKCMYSADRRLFISIASGMLDLRCSCGKCIIASMAIPRVLQSAHISYVLAHISYVTSHTCAYVTKNIASWPFFCALY